MKSLIFKWIIITLPLFHSNFMYARVVYLYIYQIWSVSMASWWYALQTVALVKHICVFLIMMLIMCAFCFEAAKSFPLIFRFYWFLRVMWKWRLEIYKFTSQSKTDNLNDLIFSKIFKRGKIKFAFVVKITFRKKESICPYLRMQMKLSFAKQ